MIIKWKINQLNEKCEISIQISSLLIVISRFLWLWKWIDVAKLVSQYRSSFRNRIFSKGNRFSVMISTFWIKFISKNQFPFFSLFSFSLLLLSLGHTMHRNFQILTSVEHFMSICVLALLPFFWLNLKKKNSPWVD